MNLKRVFHKVFREFRLKGEYSQERLARKMGLCLSTVRRWDVGKGIPDVEQYFNLLELLGEDMHTTLVNKTLRKSKTKEPNQNES